jgi:hypothetical protein
MSKTFLDYWDTRIDWLKEHTDTFLRPTLMNTLYDEAQLAWNAALDKPTGVVRVEKCTCNLAYNDNKFREECECSGSGEIVTELTQEECVEVLKQIIICGRYVLVVSDFSRLQVAKEK